MVDNSGVVSNGVSNVTEPKLTPAAREPEAQRLPKPRAMTPAAITQRQTAAIKGGMYVKAESGLRLRYRRVRRLVAKMRITMPWLDAADEPAARAWAELEIIASTAFADLYVNGITAPSGDPRRLLSEYRQLRTAQLGYERDLGMTPLARMALKVGASKSRALDAAAVSDDDVQAIEARLMAKIGREGQESLTARPPEPDPTGSKGRAK